MEYWLDAHDDNSNIMMNIFLSCRQYIITQKRYASFIKNRLKYILISFFDKIYMGSATEK